MITVEELAGYIPHGLTFKAITGWIFKADSLVMEKADIFAYSESRGGNIGMYALRDNMKPLLHSLDKIDKTIVHEDKELYLIEFINREWKKRGNRGSWYVGVPFVLSFREAGPPDRHFGRDPENWPHWIVQLLYKYHFDVHNLIPRGLAIEKS